LKNEVSGFEQQTDLARSLYKADVDCEKQFIAVPDYALVAGKRRIRLRTDLEHETAVMSLFFTKISTATGQSRQADG
jgi:hypothetical protein